MWKKIYQKNSSFRHNEKHDHAFTIRQLTLVKMSNHRESKRRKITHIQVKQLDNFLCSLKATIFIFLFHSSDNGYRPRARHWTALLRFFVNLINVLNLYYPRKKENIPWFASQTRRLNLPGFFYFAAYFYTPSNIAVIDNIFHFSPVENSKYYITSDLQNRGFFRNLIGSY